MSDSIDTLLMTGHQYYLARRYGDALYVLEKARDIYPDNPEIHYWLGYVHLAMKETQSALVDWEQAARLAPDDGRIYLAMASAYRLAGDEQNTHELREMVSRFQGDETNREIALGLLSIQRKDFQQALIHYESAAQHRPGSAHVAGYVGHAQLGLGKNKEARESYLLATRDPMAVPAAFYNLAVAETRLGNYEAAAQALQRAIQTDSNYQRAYLKLSSIEVRLRRWRLAWHHFRQALQCSPAMNQCSNVRKRAN